MEQHSLLVFARDLRDCKCYDTLKKHYIIFRTIEKEEFLENLKQENADACIVCFASNQIEINQVFDKSDLSTKLPILICSDKINHEYVDQAVKYGVNCFITFNMSMKELDEIIIESVSLGKAKEYLKSLILNKTKYSSYSGKFIDIIVESFPKRLHEKDVAKKLDISARYLQKMCKECFNCGFNRLQRRLRVFNALRLMKNTELENYQISLHLNYSEGSSMARDFMKELRYPPSEARQLLKEQTPKEQMLSAS